MIVWAGEGNIAHSQEPKSTPFNKPASSKTKVVADLKFIDKATGEVLYQGSVDGKVIIGFFIGEPLGATRGLAKEVAKLTKQKFF